MSEESDYCGARTMEEARKHVVHAHTAAMPVWAAASLLQRERATLMASIRGLVDEAQIAERTIANLESRVRELEADLAVMRASPRETFDPQAVRELLAQIAKDTGTIGSAHFVREAARRVSESEKK